MGMKLKEDTEFFVEGFVCGSMIRRIIVARSCNQAMYLFCREMQLSQSEDVPALRAINLETGKEQYARSINAPVEPYI